MFDSGSHLAQAERAALIKVDGSSTVFPITEAVAEEFQKDRRGMVRVTVGISGTGGAGSPVRDDGHEDFDRVRTLERSG